MRLRTFLEFFINLSLWSLVRCAGSLSSSCAYVGQSNISFEQVPVSPPIYSSHSDRERRSAHGDRIMAYWGHTPGTRNTSLIDVCKEASLDILIIGWVLDFSLPGNFPRFDFGTGCKTLTSEHGPETMYGCKDRAEEISLCQSLGTKVFIGIGGASSSINFTSRKNAVDAADSLWTLFSDNSFSTDLQPFAGISFDGFDLDHENGSPDYFDVFAQSLRKLFESTRKQFSLSACVSCAGTDPMPQSVFPELDMVSVRFYNAKICNWGSTNFITSLQSWCDELSNASGGTRSTPKLYIGLLAFETSGSGYVPPDNIPILLREAISTAGPCMGGSMLWDSTMSIRTKAQDGRTFVSVVKDAMRRGS